MRGAVVARPWTADGGADEKSRGKNSTQWPAGDGASLTWPLCQTAIPASLQLLQQFNCTMAPKKRYVMKGIF
jgi:hypothetical protein